MRVIYLFISMILCVNANSQGILFEKSTKLDEVFALSQKEKKYIFIDFYTPWCAPCKKMEKEVFSNKDVGDFFNKHFVNVKINAELESNKALVYNYFISSYPTYVFLNSSGEVIHRGMDAMPVDVFIDLGNLAVDFNRNYQYLEKKIKEGDRSAEILTKYFDFIPFNDEKEKLTIEYFSTLTDEEKESETAWMFLRNYIYDVKSAPFLYFASHVQNYVNRFGAEKVEKKMVAIFQDIYNEDRSYFNALKKYSPDFYSQVEKKLNNNYK